MKFLFLFFFVGLVANSLGAALPEEEDERAITIVNRAGWGARPPNGFTTMSTPVLYVVVHHSAGASCSTNAACEAQMRSIQNSHMDGNGWADIGYNFGVGGNGLAYEARGWTRVGAHAPGFNDRSIGICTIGTFTSARPPANQLTAIRELIAYGVSIGRISGNYRLIGHRQAVATECPGNALYNEIRTWPNWVANPTYEDIQEGWTEEGADKII